MNNFVNDLFVNDLLDTMEEKINKSTLENISLKEDILPLKEESKTLAKINHWNNLIERIKLFSSSGRLEITSNPIPKIYKEEFTSYLEKAGYKVSIENEEKFDISLLISWRD